VSFGLDMADSGIYDNGLPQLCDRGTKLDKSSNGTVEAEIDTLIFIRAMKGNKDQQKGIDVFHASSYSLPLLSSAQPA
jgi:hypothetical protein